MTGGSQGARLFGEVIPSAIAQLPETLRKRLHVVQQVREEQLTDVQAHYEAAGVHAELSPFFSNMAERLANAHFVIARSGASSVTELAVVGRPSLLIPLAIAMDDHQTGNAETLKAAGGADVISEADFTPERTAAILKERLSDAEGLQALFGLGWPLQRGMSWPIWPKALFSPRKYPCRPDGRSPRVRLRQDGFAPDRKDGH